MSLPSSQPVDKSGLARATLLFYGLPGLVTAIPTIPVFTLLPAFYAEQVGLGLAVTGVVLFAGHALDVVTDPLVGWLSDRDSGRSLRTLLLTGALIGAPALVLLLSPPSEAGPLWLLVWSAALYLGWTLVQIPYLTWGARLSADYHERTRLTASREGAVLVGIVLSGSLPALLGFYGLPAREQLTALAWIAIALGVPAFFLLFRKVPAPAPHRPAGSSWRGITRNRLFLRLLSAWFINGLANSIPAGLFSLWNMATKLALAVAAVVVLPALGALGLEQEPPTATALGALPLIYALLPCVLKLSAVAMMRTLPLTPRRQSAISARLGRRDLAGQKD